MSLTFSTRPFLVATFCVRPTTARASAYEAPEPVAASTAALQRSRIGVPYPRGRC
jgi:hypothetical protein